MDAAFLSELSELLGDSAEARYDAVATRGQEGLLLASHQLEAETEALLLSCSQETSDDGMAQLNDTSPTEVARGREQLVERRKTRKDNANKRRRKYNKKVEDERKLLKQQEQELSKELGELQAKQSENKWLLEKTKLILVWQAIATRQLQGRLVVEAKRRRLRDLVVRRTKLVQVLGEKMHEHLHSNAALLDDGTSEESATLLEPNDSVLFERYLAEAGAAYEQIDNVLRAWRVDEAPLASCSPDPKYLRDGELEYVEKFDVQLVPFPFQQTGGGVWQSMRLFYRTKGSRRQQFKSVADPENTIAYKFEVEGRNESGKLSNVLVWLVV